MADIAERRRKDPNWNPQTDPTYSGPHPAFVQMMSEAEFERYVARKEEERRWLLGDPRPRRASGGTPGKSAATTATGGPRMSTFRPAHPRPATRLGVDPARRWCAARSQRTLDRNPARCQLTAVLGVGVTKTRGFVHPDQTFLTRPRTAYAGSQSTAMSFEVQSLPIADGEPGFPARGLPGN